MSKAFCWAKSLWIIFWNVSVSKDSKCVHERRYHKSVLLLLHKGKDGFHDKRSQKYQTQCKQEANKNCVFTQYSVVHQRENWIRKNCAQMVNNDHERAECLANSRNVPLSTHTRRSLSNFFSSTKTAACFFHGVLYYQYRPVPWMKKTCERPQFL